MEIKLANEVGRLGQVLVHRPDNEIVRMTQDELEQFQFEDLLSHPVAAREHGMLQEILRASGASVLEFTDLLSLALRRAPPEAIVDLMDRVCDLAGVPGVAPFLAAWSPERLSAGLTAGVYWEELEGAPRTLERLRARLDGRFHMPIRPLPKLMFLRDAAFAVYNHVVIGRSASSTRAREPLLAQFALKWSGFLGDRAPLLFDRADWDRAPLLRALEGSDLLVPSERFLLIGCSERTSPQTIERLAEEALFPAYRSLERIYAVMLPRSRSVLHLDNLITQVDQRLFLGHLPAVTSTSDAGQHLPVVRLRRGKAPEVVPGAAVADVLRDELGPDVDIIPCGGHEPLHQEREQWTDGANAVCLAPGQIVLYGRNVHTLAVLEDEYGFGVSRMSPVQAADERREVLKEGFERRRNVFTFSGSELSRARGGLRSLTLTLSRDPVGREPVGREALGRDPAGA